MQMSTDTSVALTDAEAAAQFGYLRTTGRVTGREHEIEMWFAVDAADRQRLYLLSGGRDRSNWVRNLRRQPAMRFRIGERIWEGIARELIPDDPLEAVARDRVCTKYQAGFSTESERQDFHDRALPFALQLGALSDDSTLRAPDPQVERGSA